MTFKELPQEIQTHINDVCVALKEQNITLRIDSQEMESVKTLAHSHHLDSNMVATLALWNYSKLRFIDKLTSEFSDFKRGYKNTLSIIVMKAKSHYPDEADVMAMVEEIEEYLNDDNRMSRDDIVNAFNSNWENVDNLEDLIDMAKSKFNDDDEIRQLVAKGEQFIQIHRKKRFLAGLNGAMSRYKDYKDRDIEAKIFEAKLKFCDDDEVMSAVAICEHEIEADTQKARTEKEGKAATKERTTQLRIELKKAQIQLEQMRQQNTVELERIRYERQREQQEEATRWLKKIAPYVGKGILVFLAFIALLCIVFLILGVK